MTTIFIDADACPVKDETYTVASRYELWTVLVANQRMHVPDGLAVELVVVDKHPDAADDWIAEEVRAADVVITQDPPLAARCLEAGAFAIGPNGREFDEDSIGGALATREIKSVIRESGGTHAGPRAMSARDRSRFSNELDRIVNKALRSA